MSGKPIMYLSDMHVMFVHLLMTSCRLLGPSCQGGLRDTGLQQQLSPAALERVQLTR